MEPNCEPPTEGSVDIKESDSQNPYSYVGEECIYTDPATGFQCKYQWNTEEKKWDLKPSDDPTNNHKYDKCGDTYTYKDEATGKVLIWDLLTKVWKVKEENRPRKKRKKNSDEEFDSSDESEDERVLEQKKADISSLVQIDSNGVKTYKDPTDGTVFEWDEERKGWIPKLDDEFLASYQLNYGDCTSTEVTKEESVEQIVPVKKEEAKPSEPSWFEVEAEKNPKVYVSNLPLDFTEEDFVALLSKCGMIEKDLETQKYKIKLYKDMNGQFKGDGLCTYLKIESVALALDILDGSAVGDQTIRVERAKFTLKGDYDPSKKPRKRKKKDQDKLKKKMEKIFDWRPDKLRGERSSNENVVVLKRLFKPIVFDTEPALIIEYKRDLREECSKFGHVKRVLIFDRNEEGTAQVFFRTPEEADRCIEVLHGRWFAGQKITAETWDGVTKYRVEETEEEKAQRLAKWDDFLAKDDEEDDD